MCVKTNGPFFNTPRLCGTHNTPFYILLLETLLHTFISCACAALCRWGVGRITPPRAGRRAARRRGKGRNKNPLAAQSSRLSGRGSARMRPMRSLGTLRIECTEYTLTYYVLNSRCW